MKIENFKDLNYNTQLLESLGWDEEQLNSLYLYLDNIFTSASVYNVTDVLNTVSEFYGEETKNCLSKIFKEVMITNNLHTVEHDSEH